ncbi:hypothetical protein GU930_10045 [Pantoea vagans]|nr:hypothetical protein [Pantoea vagans]NBB55458.1 hypothetical protein [Pantoea vagans]
MRTLQLFIKGRWYDAAQLNIQHPLQGRESAALLAYDYLDQRIKGWQL